MAEVTLRRQIQAVDVAVVLSERVQASERARELNAALATLRRLDPDDPACVARFMALSQGGLIHRDEDHARRVLRALTSTAEG
jgi:hypothetical protein